MSPASGSDPRAIVHGAISASFKPKARKALGYIFGSKLSMETVRAKLNAKTQWDWAKRISDTHGEYLLSRPVQDYVRVRIFSLPPYRYHLDVLFVGESTTTWPKMDEYIRTVVLSEIESFNIEEAGHFD